jgi:cellulose biosynthesis protein BcsQ
MTAIALYSAKGGVGKTSLAVNLAWCAATLSARRTLLWDLDPQAASSWLLAAPPVPGTAHTIFTGETDIAARARPTAFPRLDILAADASMRDLDRLFHDLDKRKRLQKLLRGLKDYDRIVLDCPPGLSDTAEQVMRGADLIVAPVVPSPLSTRAYEEVLSVLGGRTPVLPVFSMVDRRRRLHAEALAAHPDWPVIPMASTIETMAATRAPVGSFAPRTAAAQSIATLWRAIEKRLAA